MKVWKEGFYDPKLELIFRYVLCKSMLSEEIADDSVCGPRDCVLGVAGVL